MKLWILEIGRTVSAGVVLAGGGYVGVRVRRLLGMCAEKRWPSNVLGGVDVVTMRTLAVCLEISCMI